MIEAERGQMGIEFAAQLHPDCLILDLGLPDIDGLEVLRRIRSWSTVPVVILTARGQEQDKITLLDAGADDYLTKPLGSVSCWRVSARPCGARRVRRPARPR